MTTADSTEDMLVFIYENGGENGLPDPTSTACSDDCSSTAASGENDDEGGDSHHRQQHSQAEDERVLNLLEELKRYMEWLPLTPMSLNARLDAEHNSQDEKAQGLLQYYQERPQLLDYTLEKELPRMKYYWIDSKSGEFIQDDKARIAVLLLEASLSDNPVHQILARCANQSLLADLLQFLTSTASTDSANETEADSNASLIRQQFHMAVHTCQVDITIMPSNGTVLVKAVLDLNLPHPVHNFVPIAQVHVSAQFSPMQSPPLFHYHVESVQVCFDLRDQPQVLLEIARFIVDLPSFEIEEEEDDDESAVTGPLVRGLRIRRQLTSHMSNPRDAFLQRTQSAWKQVNSSAHKLLFRQPTSTSTTTASAEEEATAASTTLTIHEVEEEEEDLSSFHLKPVEVRETPCASASEQHSDDQSERQLKNGEQPNHDHHQDHDEQQIQEESAKSEPQDALQEQQAPQGALTAQCKEMDDPSSSSAPPSNDEESGKKPGLPKSLIRIRDAQRATWKKQMSRLKSTAASINHKHRALQQQVQQAEQQRLIQYRQQKLQQQQIEQQQMQMQKPQQTSTNDVLNLAASRLLPRQSESARKSRSPKSQQQQQGPQQESPSAKNGSPCGSTKKWNAMLRSRWNRVAKSASFSINRKTEDPESDEWIFLPTKDDADRTMSTFPGDDCSSTVDTTNEDQLSAVTDHDTPMTNLGGELSYTKHADIDSSASPSMDDQSLLFQGTDVWAEKHGEGSSYCFTVDPFDRASSSAEFSAIASCTSSKSLEDNLGAGENSDKNNYDRFKAHAVSVSSAPSKASKRPTAIAPATSATTPLRENGFWQNKKEGSSNLLTWRTSTKPSNSSRRSGVLLKVMA
ncbi:hypothetical protein ACA910_005740 [Epithemia clementina (nom. ined.)]